MQQLWQQQGIDLAHFGWIWGALTLVAAVAGRWAHRFEAAVGPKAVLLFIGLAPALGYAGLEMLGVVGGLIISATFFLARGFGLVILRDALNKRVPSEFRATANSIASFGFRGAFVVTGPVVGHVFDLWGMSTTLLMLAMVTLVMVTATRTATAMATGTATAMGTVMAMATLVIFVTLILLLIAAVKALPDEVVVVGETGKG